MTDTMTPTGMLQSMTKCGVSTRHLCKAETSECRDAATKAKQSDSHHKNQGTLRKSLVNRLNPVSIIGIYYFWLIIKFRSYCLNVILLQKDNWHDNKIIIGLSSYPITILSHFSTHPKLSLLRVVRIYRV